MRNYIALLLMISLFPTVLSAQNNYKPGYAIETTGDTLKGFIDYREWDRNPEAVNFKFSLTDKQARKLTINDLAAFEVNGLEAYKRYEGPVSMDYTDANHVNETRDTSFKTKVIFLKILIKGARVTLFSYTDDVKTRFFTQESGQPIEELIYRSYNAVDNNSASQGSRPVNENVYFRQLSILADKYHLLDAAMQRDIQRSDYYKQNLIKIVSQINGISKADYEKKYNETAKISFSGSIALNISAINPYGNYKAAGGKSVTSIFPAVSFGIGVFVDPNTEKLEFLIQGILSGNQYQSVYIYTGSPYVPTKYSYSQLWFAVTPQVVYNFYNTPGFKIFAGAGLALTFHNYYNAKYDLNYAATQVSNGNLSDLNLFNNFTLPLIVKAGVKAGGRVEIFAAYFTNSAVTSDHYFQLDFNSLQLGLNYIIK